MSGYRPAPFADPQHITQTEVMDLTRDTRGQRHVSTRGRHQTSIVRSNSLRRPAAEFDQDSLEDKPNMNARIFYPGMEDAGYDHILKKMDPDNLKEPLPQKEKRQKKGK